VLTKAGEKLLVALRRRTERERRGLFLAEGVRVMEAAIATGLDFEMAVVTPEFAGSDRGAELLEALRARTSVRTVPESVLARVAATDTPQGVVAAVRTPRASFGSVLLPDRATLLVLDAVQDPGNFGTLVRTADALGAVAVLALDGTVDPWNPKAVRAAAGSSFHLPVVVAATGPALAWLKTERFRILAADSRGEPIERVPTAPRTALVVGNEGAGIGPAVQAAADARVAVPIRGSAESLNVGVAAGILLYLLTRER
jgi:TrmH family RNA methyltransferase